MKDHIMATVEICANKNTKALSSMGDFALFCYLLFRNNKRSELKRNGRKCDQQAAIGHLTHARTEHIHTNDEVVVACAAGSYRRPRQCWILIACVRCSAMPVTV